MLLLFAFLFFSYWPYWLQSATWTGFCYCIVGYFVIGGSRIIIWLVFYHIGVDLWMFPKYRDSWKPNKFLWPIVSAEKRSDMLDPKAIIFKFMSGALIAYSCWSFCQDEKNVKDLKDFATTGVSDLLDYGTEWITTDHQIGNMNKTESEKEKEKSFDDKIKEQMNVDVDNIDEDIDTNKEPEDDGKVTFDDDVFN